MSKAFNTIRLSDCIAGMNDLPAGCVDLVFADPPFNIGYDYDVYEDSLEHQQYINWSAEWISAVFGTLKPNGTFWLAIGDDYAAELKLESQKIGFHCRSWVIWYYTFGVNCSHKFTRSHTHLFHFVKDREDFTFRDEDLRVPSARELVYNDKRANPKGRLPDDTWIIPPAGLVGQLVNDDDGSWTPQALAPPVDNDRTFTLRPQDLEQSFSPAEDTWYIPRVAGTFKERAGFHGCQMPEQVLGRIIRTCSNPGDLVLDPFSGSATTLAVAKKLGRRFLGFDLSKDYVRHGRDRLNAIRVGDRLDGSPEPSKSAQPTTKPNRKKGPSKKSKAASLKDDLCAREKHYDKAQLVMTMAGVAEAFRRTHDGFSADRVVADPNLNEEFVNVCADLGLVGDARTWNVLLFRLRKRGKLAHIRTSHRTGLSWEDCDKFIFASEIAWQSMLNDGYAGSLDEILCDPALAAEFDKLAGQLAPGFKPLDYRWGALKLRKEAKDARSRASVLESASSLRPRFREKLPMSDLRRGKLPAEPGLYILSHTRTDKLYVGETLNLRTRLTLRAAQKKAWQSFSDSVSVQMWPMDCSSAGKLAWQSRLVKEYKPRLNCFELRPAS
jgi:site-specific DNA-methyltransferase (adenine-specific)